MDALRENIKYISDLVAAACAVLDLEYERVNAGGGEPYYPLANPGQFDPRVVALAKVVAVDYLNEAPTAATPCRETSNDPINLREAVDCLTNVFVCVRNVQSAFSPGSKKWSLARKSCVEIEEAIRLLEMIPQQSFGDEDLATPCREQDLHLDTDVMNKARALHRVWRALNDGDCPKCHTFHRASEITSDFGRPMPIEEWDGSFVTQGIGCPTCGFKITREEIVEIEKMFAPAMDAAVAVFEEWRSQRKMIAS